MSTIKEKLSNVSLDQCLKKSAPWQPSKRGGTIYSIEIDGHFWYLERTYEWSALDQSFVSMRYADETKEIWPEDLKLQKQTLGVFDNRGYWWVRKELSSQFLIPYYLKHPDEYLRVMNNHVNDVKKLVETIKEVNQALGDENQLKTNLKRMKKAYYFQYGCPSTIYYVCDELVWEFKKFLLTFLDKRETNIYLSNFLKAEITSKLIEKNEIQGIATKFTSRGVLFAAEMKPSTKYYPPKFWHSYPQDAEVIKQLIASGASAEKINKFNAFRQIVPVAFQINDEAHYVESQILSAHLGYLLKKVAEKTNKNIEELGQFSCQQIIDLLTASEQSAKKERSSAPILTGLGVSAGQASGKIKIITNESDFQNFNQGDVLVAKITDPSMVALMAKSNAIVTDIGGMTSHPAITCREMGIPCVVATKNATSQLQDNMEVLVDGTAGKVFTKEIDGNSDYDDLIQAYRQGFSGMDVNTFDISTDYSKLDPLIAEVWIKHVLNIIDECKNQNLSNKEIGDLLYTPSTVRNINIFDSFMASIAKVARTEREKIANFYINILKAICLKDPFALNYQNVIHSADEIKKETAKVKPANPNIAKKLGHLINACYHLSYSLFGDMNPQLMYENYGPYYVKDKLGQKYLVVIKEFKNMRPVEIWPEIADLPFEKIRIINIYQDVEFSIDAITHPNYKGDTINGLKFFAIEIDGQLVGLDEIDKSTKIIQKYVESIWSKFKNLSDKDFRIKHLYHKSYSYRNLCHRLGLEWQPTQEMIDEITKKPLKQWPAFDNQDEMTEFFLKIIDPRTDFAG